MGGGLGSIAENAGLAEVGMNLLQFQFWRKLDPDFGLTL